MTGIDCQIYEGCKEKAKNMGLTLALSGDRLKITRNGLVAGYFPCVADVFHYLCGFEYGSEIYSLTQKEAK